MKPFYKINIASLNIDSTQISSAGLLVDMVVNLQLNRVNSAWVVLHPGSNIPSIANGDPVEIELGVDESQKVFTGTIQGIERGIQSRTVYCQSSFTTLVSNKVNKLYEKQKAGDIVNDFAGIAGISTATVENGLDYPVYALGEDRSMFEHLLNLARRSGFDCYADVNDKLIFAKYTGSAVHPFQFGANIIQLHLDEETVPVEGVEVYGESPSSLGQGADAYSWLTKKEVKGTAGAAAGNILRLSDPVLKDLETAGAAAQSILGQRSKAKSGFLKAPGNAKVELGDAIQISAMPDNSINGTYKITGVKHILSKLKGFTTTIYWTEA